MTGIRNESGRLCHPDGKKSCGACCGMYNHRQTTPDEVTRRLRQRSDAYRNNADIRDEASLRAFRRRWEDKAADKLLADLPSCPFLGFIDLEEVNDQGQRVGCLVHPLQNDGIDGRDCGVYDRFICEDYLCAAHDILKRHETRLVIDAVEDSFLYGLVITNPRMVRSLLDIVATRLGGAPSKARLRAPGVVAAAAAVFELMRAWPHRGADGIFGQVEVAGPLQTRRRAHPAEALGQEATAVDVLLVCLGTVCRDIQELQEARRKVEERIDRLVEALELAAT